MNVVRIGMGNMGEEEIWFLTRPSVRSHRKIVIMPERGEDA